MAGETTSPSMNMPIPGVAVTNGPEWASDLNTCLTIIDGHDHASGLGVQINPSGININADVAFNANNAVTLRSARFSPQLSPLALPADLGCLYESGVDLWYNDGSGNQVRITQSGGVAGSPGSISNLTSPATASYVAANGTFVWQQAANTSADMDFGSAIMRNDTANSKALTLSPPAAMGADYSIVLPSIPGSTLFMTLDSGGTMGTASNVQGSQLAAGTITGTQIATATITPDKLSALGQQVSASSGSYSTTSQSSANAVTNLSVTITTTGRPIFVGIMSDSTGTGGLGAFTSGSRAQPIVTLIRGSTKIATASFQSSGTVVTIPPALWQIDVVGAGTYTYTVHAFSANSDPTTVQVSNIVLVAYEI